MAVLISSDQEVHNSGGKDDWQHAGERGGAREADVAIALLVKVVDGHDCEVLKEGYPSLVKVCIELLCVGVATAWEDKDGVGDLHRVALFRIGVVIGYQNGVGLKPSATRIECFRCSVQVAVAVGILRVKVELPEERLADADDFVFRVGKVGLTRVAGEAREFREAVVVSVLALIGPESFEHVPLDKSVMTGRAATQLSVTNVLEFAVRRHLSVGV